MADRIRANPISEVTRISFKYFQIQTRILKMEGVFRCKEHHDVALYVNTKPFSKQPILLCQRCILTKNDDAVLINDFLNKFQSNFLQESYHSVDSNKITNELNHLRDALLEVCQLAVSYLVKKLQDQWNKQFGLLNQIQTYLQNKNPKLQKLDPSIVDPEQIFREFINNKVKASTEQKYQYLTNLMFTQKQPQIDLVAILTQWKMQLDKLIDQSNLINLIEADFTLNITQPNKLSESDFEFTKSIKVTTIYPKLMEFSNHIERITLTLNSPISLQPLNCFTNLKELNIQLLHCNLGSSGRVQIPNLTKVSLTIEGNELTSLDPISLPYTVRELALNFASNRLAFESLRVIETSLSKLLLKSLVLNFNGYSLSSNQIFDEGIECNKLGLNYLYIITRRQQLRKFHLGLGRCGLTDVGVQYSLIPMIETQRKLKYLKLDLFSNQITRLEPLEYICKLVPGTIMNLNQNPLVSQQSSLPTISTRNCAHFQ